MRLILDDHVNIDLQPKIIYLNGNQLNNHYQLIISDIIKDELRNLKPF